MSLGFPSFEAIFVVSDLHIGGTQERSIFQDEARLAAFIRHVASVRPGEPVALVLAGDIVDFLAEEDARRFDPLGAAKKLQDIIDRFPHVFNALKAFTATEGRRLVLVLGNHDVELALPPVIETLLENICEDDAARGRVNLALDGAGFRASVGGRSVLILHGNEADDWNVPDHELVRQTSAALLRGGKLPPWRANAGTTLVVEVLNRIKRSHPFIDLLKPEDHNLIALLVAMEPSVWSHLKKFPEIVLKLMEGKLQRRGWLGELGDSTGSAPGRAETPEAERTLIAQAIAHADAKVRPTELATEGNLGWGDAIVRRQGGKANPSLIREEIRRWQEAVQDTFKPTHTSQHDKAIIAPVSGEVDILIAGHTHTARSQPRAARMRTRDGTPWYFNSGTWIALFDMPPHLLGDDAAFAPVWKALQGEDRTPRKLLEENSPVLRYAATAVRVEVVGDEVTGALLRFPGAGDAPQPEPEGCAFQRRAEEG